MVSNGIANHYRGPTRRTEYLVRRGDFVQDLVRAVEIIPVSAREKTILLHLATGGPHMTSSVRDATRLCTELVEALAQRSGERLYSNLSQNEQRATSAKPGIVPDSSGTKVPEGIGKPSDDMGTVSSLPYERERRRERF